MAGYRSSWNERLLDKHLASLSWGGGAPVDQRSKDHDRGSLHWAPRIGVHPYWHAGQGTQPALTAAVWRRHSHPASQWPMARKGTPLLPFACSICQQIIARQACTTCGLQAVLCLLVSTFSLALLRRSRPSISDAEAPLLPCTAQHQPPKALVSKPLAGEPLCPAAVQHHAPAADRE